MMSPVIRPESAADLQAIRDINRMAFGGDAEASLVDALRKEGLVHVSLVAVLNERVVGHILLSPVIVRSESFMGRILSLAPMSVLPEFQKQGIGSQLVRAAIAESRKSHFTSIVVLGHPLFYQRFGFSAALARELTSPFGSGDAWMALELVPGALEGVTGTIEYPAVFSMFE